MQEQEGRGQVWSTTHCDIIANGDGMQRASANRLDRDSPLGGAVFKKPLGFFFFSAAFGTWSDAAAASDSSPTTGASSSRALENLPRRRRTSGRRRGRSRRVRRSENFEKFRFQRRTSEAFKECSSGSSQVTDHSWRRRWDEATS